MTEKPEKFVQEKLRALNEYWKVFSNIYLNSLKPRRKWRKLVNPMPQIGDTILIVNKNLPRSTWELARVSSLERGTDNIIRSVVLERAGKSQIRRHIEQVAVLEGSRKLEQANDVSNDDSTDVTVDVPPQDEEEVNEANVQKRPRRTQNRVNYKVTRKYEKKK